MEKLTATQLKKMLESNESIPVINVLPEEHFRSKHVPGSINAPRNRDDFLPRVEKLVDDKAKDKVVVYCADAKCDASPKAARKLEEAGFRHVLDFEGGVAEWEESGYPLEGAAVLKS